MSYFNPDSCIESLTEECNLGSGTITYWLQQRRKERKTHSIIKEETDS